MVEIHSSILGVKRDGSSPAGLINGRNCEHRERKSSTLKCCEIYMDAAFGGARTSKTWDLASKAPFRPKAFASLDTHQIRGKGGKGASISVSRW